MSGGVFDPQGPIALQERNLIIAAVALMLLVAIPMLIALYTFAWKYRAGNKKAKYQPERTGSFKRQIIWWIVPAIVIAIIAVINWQSTHALDPYKAIASQNQPIDVEVIALQWKWLFIYPKQGIATVNYLEFPEQTPVHFDLTADAPMSSFWIPQLGSQIYAMSAMQSQMYLEASSTGEYAGKDTEINGAGYAGMTFTAKSVSQSDFDAWVNSVKTSTSSLTMDSYNQLAVPSEYNASAFYSSVDGTLYNTILNKYNATTTPIEVGADGDSQMGGMQM